MTAETGLPDNVVDTAVDTLGIEGAAKSPGEVPRRMKIPWLILLVALAFVAYTFLRK